jgi:hypothetical protein
MEMAVFWVVAPCSLVEAYRLFRGACCLHHQGNRPTRRYNPEDSHLYGIFVACTSEVGATVIIERSSVHNYGVDDASQ